MVINGGIEMKKIIGILALTAVLALTACTGSKNNTKDVDETSENIAVTDLLGREVEVPAEVSSIIALGAGGLRMISYAGAQDMVVGVEQAEHEHTFGCA